MLLALSLGSQTYMLPFRGVARIFQRREKGHTVIPKLGYPRDCHVVFATGFSCLLKMTYKAGGGGVMITPGVPPLATPLPWHGRF